MLIMPRRVDLRSAHIKGHVVDPWEDDPQRVTVDGIYDISTIEVNGRRETVAFRTSGFGPSQIVEPHARKTISVEEIS